LNKFNILNLQPQLTKSGTQDTVTFCTNFKIPAHPVFLKMHPAKFMHYAILYLLFKNKFIPFLTIPAMVNKRIDETTIFDDKSHHSKRLRIAGFTHKINNIYAFILNPFSTLKNNKQ